MTPRFDTVSELWKHPNGPYRQAPPEYGGQWWLVNPFTSATPWLTQSQPITHLVLPDGFEAIFGKRPEAKNYRGRGGHTAFQIAVADWERDLQYFKGAGLPPGYTADQLQTANNVYMFWGMGPAHSYEGRYGWMARFPASAIPEFEASAPAAVESVHLVIAQYQIALLQRGEVPAKRHPFVPPQLWPAESSEA